jgi:hypothetical protein
VKAVIYGTLFPELNNSTRESDSGIGVRSAIQTADKKNGTRDPVLSSQPPLIRNYEAHLYTAGMKKYKIMC